MKAVLDARGRGVLRPALPRPGVRAGRRAGGQRRGPGAVRGQGVAAGRRQQDRGCGQGRIATLVAGPPRRWRPRSAGRAERAPGGAGRRSRCSSRPRSCSTGCWSSRRSCRRSTTAASSGTGSAQLDDFVGLENFKRALRRRRLPRRAQAQRRSSSCSRCCMQLPFALGVALMLNARLHGRALLRVLYFAPFVLSEVVTGVVLTLMLQPGGLVDARHRRCRPRVAGRPEDRPLHGVRGDLVEVLRLPHDPLPRRACSRSRASSRRRR